MARDQQSVAPKERINITYKPSTGDQQAEIELPFKSLVVGDFTGRPDERPIEERTPVSIDKDNFDQVLREHDVRFEGAVPNALSGEGELSVSLKIESMRDFEPEAIAKKVPELAELLELRAALTALKGPLGNMPAFRKRLEALLKDDAARQALLSELAKDDGSR